MSNSSKAVILIGGDSKGTRFRPLSLDIPKPLFPIAGRAIVWHALRSLSQVQELQQVFLVGVYEDNVVAPFINSASRDFPNLQIKYLREYASGMGTAGGLYFFRDILLEGAPSQIYVLHADIACDFPLEELKKFHDSHRGVGTIMGVKVEREEATKFGCIVMNQESKKAIHYVEKPESYISDIINGGVYLFSASIFDEIKLAKDAHTKRTSEDPTSGQPELRLEQDVLAPLAAAGKLFVYQTTKQWIQIKSAASAIPANALLLASYKTTNPTLLRRRSPTIIQAPKVVAKASGPEIIEPCFIDETAQLHPTAKIGPNVSIGANVKIGEGCRVRDSIVLERTVLEKNSCSLYAIISEDCKLGPWSRVEGAPMQTGETKQSICILAKNVQVMKEVNVRSCIVLPSKVLSKSSKNQVLL